MSKPKGSTRTTVRWSYLVVVAAFLGLCVLLGKDAFPKLTNAGPQEWAFIVCLVAGGLALSYTYAALRDHFNGLERLRGDVLTMASRAHAVIPADSADEGGAELRQIHQAVRNLADYINRTAALPDTHLEGILKALTLPIVVISPEGLVALVNGSAKDLLGAGGLSVGEPFSACVDEASLEAALRAAAEPDRPVSATLGIAGGKSLAASLVRLQQGGVVVTFPGETTTGAAAGEPSLEYDLEVLDPLPEPGPIADDTPLAALPMLVLDTETTGLDVKGDRVVSIGAVRMVGERVFRHVTFHQLCTPGRPIPPAATKVHHITDADVADAPEFAEVWRNCLPLLEGTVMVGYNIPFDIAMLRHECHRADVEWRDPPFLDVLLLAVALIDDLRNDNLEGLTDYLGVDIQDRHNALGDSLMEAETLACLLPRLEDKGIVTYGDAKAFSQKAKRILEGQKQSGWYDDSAQIEQSEKSG
jgi:DNA polymerase III subunit epsilon